VPFFGEPAATTTGLARLAEISGAPVVPVFIVRQPDCRSHRIVIQDEIPLVRGADGQLDIEQTTARFVRAIEEMVTQYPEQFLWTHRRYRTRPDCSMPPFYDS
jgi:KDO2-lipid IV(A) lauroyltransferase